MGKGWADDQRGDANRNVDDNGMEEAPRNDERTRDMQVVRRRLKCCNDLSELYSVPRVAPIAAQLGMEQGFSLDLTTPTATGYVWDCSNVE